MSVVVFVIIAAVLGVIVGGFAYLFGDKKEEDDKNKID